MKRLLAALAGFVAIPLALVALGLLPPPAAALSAVPLLIGCALLLALLLRGALFERLSVALAVGFVAGAVTASTTLQPVDAWLRFATLVSAGMLSGWVSHALFAALDASAAAGFVYRPWRAASTAAWQRPFVHGAVWLHERHPARLKLAYRRFHIAVSAVFALAWLASLWAVGLLVRRQAGVDVTALAASGPGAAWWVAAAVLAIALLCAVVAWWITAALFLFIAVRSGRLPPFGVTPYLRDGRFPSHWVAVEHAFVGYADDDA